MTTACMNRRLFHVLICFQSLCFPILCEKPNLKYTGIGLEDNLLKQNVTIKHIVMDFSGFHQEIKGRNFTRLTRSPVKDGVSKNITMVLENLLKNYESSQLPTHGKAIQINQVSLTPL
ncbi:unnamed protein product [Acanthoscelides obtectus]|uniref:Uncharacterized protein n=1 Tax=Acanthoscelides obtectus TaxID=200917 RepID=A0A9P0NTX0_ACAOB|nr:unnamed protein product [Acanthoscelides obtectus]CAK1668066.1 hypothetical protein AOBTE_LOCUS26205 [Acanthoscelides obtectus]